MFRITYNHNKSNSLLEVKHVIAHFEGVLLELALPLGKLVLAKFVEELFRRQLVDVVHV